MGMKYKKFRLRVYPALEITITEFKEYFFDSAHDLLIAKNAIAYMLLYLQDELKVMKDYTNIFVISALPMQENSQWEEVEEEDLKL